MRDEVVFTNPGRLRKPARITQRETSSSPLRDADLQVLGGQRTFLYVSLSRLTVLPKLN